LEKMVKLTLGVGQKLGRRVSWLGFYAFSAMLLVAAFCVDGCGRPADQAQVPNESDSAADTIFGKLIHFNGTHEAEPYEVSGWSPTERNFTWTEGKAAVLALPVPPNPGALRLRLLVSAFTHPPELPFQPVEVYANGQKITDWQVGNPAENLAEIPSEVSGKATTLTIQFRTPKASAPAEYSAKADQRVLGICCHELELTKMP
jgi:hypothetical protein